MTKWVWTKWVQDEVGPWVNGNGPSAYGPSGIGLNGFGPSENTPKGLTAEKAFK